MINQITLKEGPDFEAKAAWYLVATHAGKERLTAMQLRMQGFETYLPMRAPLKAGAAAKPLFPSYMFVRVSLSAPGWRAIYSTIGVKDVLSVGEGAGRRPKAMPVGVVPGLMALERAGLIVLDAPEASGSAAAGPAPLAAGDGLSVGDRVLVPLGAAGALIEAVLAERIDANRVVVLISMLGRDSRSTVASSSLVRASAVAVQGQAASS